MQPLISWRWLLVLVIGVVLGVLWWPRTPQKVMKEFLACEVDSLYAKALSRERWVKDSLFRVLVTSPIPRESRDSFSGLVYYPIEAVWCFWGRYERLPGALLPVVGRITVPLPALSSCRAPVVLTIYGDAQGQNPYLAFWDSTAAIGETYEGGRYVPIFVRGDSALIDFNRAYFPYCAYNPSYICLPYPPSNRFCAYIRAGERYGSYSVHP